MPHPIQPNDPFGNRMIGLSLTFWVMVALTGIGAGLAAGLFMLLLHGVQHLCYDYHAGTFLQAVQRQPAWRRVLVVCAAGLMTSLGLFTLRHALGGSGGKLDERIWFHSGQMAEGKTIAQSVLSIVLVGMGASLGRETAPKQTGAAIASWLSRTAGLSSAECRLLAACGAGAGMAAVYNVPLGGALVALEVLLGTLALPLIPPALAASTIATAVAWLLLPDRPTYSFTSQPMLLSQLVWSLVFGPVAGLTSVAYVRLIVYADSLKQIRSMAKLLPLVAFAGLAAASTGYPQLLGNGKDVVQLVFDNHLGLTLLLILLILKPIATAACLGSGAPGGLFTPTMTFGALLGGLCGRLWSVLWPGATAGSYGLIGATAVLAAAMQAPITALVLVLELTHHTLTMFVPVLFAVAGASLTARRIDPRSIYSGRVHLGRQAAGTAPGPPLAFGQLLHGAPRIISVAATYPEVLARLQEHDMAARPLYALDEAGRMVGRIAPARAAAAAALTQVLSSGAGGDLADPVGSLTPDLSLAAACRRLEADAFGELPVIEPLSGRLIGVARRPVETALDGPQPTSVAAPAPAPGLARREE